MIRRINANAEEEILRQDVEAFRKNAPAQTEIGTLAAEQPPEADPPTNHKRRRKRSSDGKLT